jgi:hypothetical protein
VTAARLALVLALVTPALTGLAGLAAGGCADPAKGEAASLVAAIDRFRRAEYPGKPALLGPLKDVPCKDATVCAAKDACVAHAEPLVQAITMKTEVQLRLGDGDAAAMDLEARAAMLAKLDEASRLLDQGRAAQGACDQKTLELKIKYRF